MPQQNQPQQGGDAAQTESEGDALDELENALGTDGEPAEQPAEWTPPTREEWEAHQAALEAEKAKLARARRQAQRLREGKAPQGALAEPGEDGAGAAGPDPALSVWQQRAVRASAKSELLARDARPGMVDLLLGQLRSETVEFDDEDNPDLEEWLDRMQERFPDAFGKPEPAQPAPGRRPAGTVDQGKGSGRPVGRQMTYGERVIANSQAAMRGTARRAGM